MSKFKIIFLLPLLLFFNVPVFSSPYMFLAYDSGFYREPGISTGNTPVPGTLTAISDTYFYYDVKNQTMRVSQTEWLATGLSPIGNPGAEEPASYDSIFNYTGVTFDNMQTIFSWMPNFIFDDLKAQYAQFMLTVAEPYNAVMRDNPYVITKHARNLFYTNINQIDGRFDYKVDKGLNIWATQLYNYTRQNDSLGFTGNTLGLSAGMDKYINDNFMLGLGYTFNDSDIKTIINDINSKGHNLFLYGAYNFGQVYVNGLANYGFARYTENINHNSLSINSEHNVQNHGLVAKIGYEMPNNIRPEIGFRYIYITADSYTDSMGAEIKPDDNSALTLVSGVKYGLDINTVRLKTKLNFLYDVINDGDIVNINIAGFNTPTEWNSFSPFGIESGLGIETLFENFNISVEYDFTYRAHFLAHTGMIRMRYSF